MKTNYLKSVNASYDTDIFIRSDRKSPSRLRLSQVFLRSSFQSNFIFANTK